jgi:hypothetical protein
MCYNCKGKKCSSPGSWNFKSGCCQEVKRVGMGGTNWESPFGGS